MLHIEHQTSEVFTRFTPVKITQKKIWLILPAYNEEQNIGPLIERVDECLSEDQIHYQIVVVDDGSNDGTLEVVKRYSNRLPITIIQHTVNKGLGTTVKDGLIYASENASPSDVVVVMDADNTHTPGLILQMLRHIKEGNDVIIASRYQPGANVRGVPFLRKILSLGASLTFRIFFPTHGVKDFTCGYRAYRAKVLKDAFLTYGRKFVDQDGFACMVDILLKLRQMNVIFREVPLILRYDVKEGVSKMKILKTVTQSLNIIIQRKLNFSKLSLSQPLGNSTQVPE